MRENISARYWWAAVSSYTIWGFFNLALTSLRHIPSLDILFYRVLFSSVLLMAIIAIFRRKSFLDVLRAMTKMETQERNRIILLDLMGGFLLTSNWFFFIYAMNHISVKSASYAYLVCPILTAFLGYLLLREKLTFVQWTAVVISMMSCAVMATGALKDLFFSLIVAFSYALYLVSQRKITRFDKLFHLTIQMSFSVILLTCFSSFFGAPPAEAGFYGMITLIALVFTILPLLLNLYSLRGLNSATVGILMYINPLMNFGFALFYYKEGASAKEYLAYLLIAVSIVVFNSKWKVVSGKDGGCLEP